MQTIEVQTFSFDELSSEAKSYAIEKERNSKSEYGDMLYFLNDDIKEQAHERNFDIPKDGIVYSLSYCQGDGLSFSSDPVNKDKFIKDALPDNTKQSILDLLNDRLTIETTHNKGHYCFAAKSQVLVEFDDNGKGNLHNLNELVATIENHVQNEYMDLCRAFEKQGYDEIEYELSDECIIETIKANEFQFLSNGRMPNF